MERTKNFLKIFVTLLLFFITLNGISQTLTYRDLVDAQNEVNGVCPMMVDAITRLDNCIALPSPLSIQYNYTIITMSKFTTDIPTISSKMRKILVSMIKTNEALAIFRENNIVLIYRYSDKNNLFMFKLIITSDDYKD